MSKENNKPLHRPNGQFAPGHAKVGGSKKGKSLRQYRDVMMQQVSPFLENLGSIIGQIEDPGDQVLAISRVLKYTMPTYSSVEYTDKAPRNLTAEEQIAKLNAQAMGRPDPTENEEDDE